MASLATKPKLAVILGTMTFGYRQMRINDLNTVQSILEAFKAQGWNELVYPIQGGEHQPERLKELFKESLKALKVNKVDIFYLHAPDHTTPIESTLGAVQELYQAGHFTELGLSNYASWQVVDIYHICKNKGYVLPTVYQGMYNAITRGVEAELFPCLRKFNIRFYAYNPIAGGIFNENFSFDGDVPKGSRFDPNTAMGKLYRPRYVTPAHAKAVANIQKATASHGYSAIEAAFRWMRHHSKLDAALGDGVIIGGSSLEHIVSACQLLDKDQPLEEDVIKSLDDGWKTVMVSSAPYFR
ncbi:9048_t:CDS:2 [Paraglomus occultum]|uniref:9048_t:CDS:1 n=1 Tax=Paraglomus occultum TaxID=144539 RepID=A0A9N8WMU2_9GLOM|nr:9048_t:CDS:2 [Paraglomus occultum]